uniref:Uncharacterized protein n=1 Tax=Rhizophora mucronata TaxID=61149 RepID=A0A2P2NJH0_RHIMU
MASSNKSLGTFLSLTRRPSLNFWILALNFGPRATLIVFMHELSKPISHLKFSYRIG